MNTRENIGNGPFEKDYKPSGISRAEEAARKKYPIYWAKAVMFDGNTIEFDASETTRNIFKLGYEQAEKDILSRFTKEHLEGLKWIENSEITSQPIPYHKYCKDLCRTLEELLNK